MTTNGQTRIDQYVYCVDAGLSELNISIHTLDPTALGQLMSPPRSTRWGADAIAAQLELCRVLAGRVTIKINTCVGESEEQPLRIYEFVRDLGLHWRIMKVLGRDEVSNASMKRLCAILGAEAVSARLVKGTSSCSMSMRTREGFSFSTKLIRPFRLTTMCNGCPILSGGECYEFAYGPRLENAGGVLRVRNCIHRNGAPFVIPCKTFFDSPVALEVRGIVR